MVYLSLLGVVALSYLTTSILPLLEFALHYGIFVMIVGGGNKISDDFYSALRENIPHYSIFVMIGGGRIKLSDQFCSAPSRVFAPIWYIYQE